jgi:hypothetical protein
VTPLGLSLFFRLPVMVDDLFQPSLYLRNAHPLRDKPIHLVQLVCSFKLLLRINVPLDGIGYSLLNGSDKSLVVSTANLAVSERFSIIK